MTIKEMLARSVRSEGTATALRYKLRGRWHTVSYQQLLERARQVAEVLHDLGVKPGDHVGLYRANSPQWPEIYFGIVGIGATAVPIDPKLQEQEVSHVLRDSETQVVFASADNYPLLRQIDSHLPTLKNVVLIGGHDILPVSNGTCSYLDYEACMEELAEKAASADRAYDHYHPRENDVASIIYTSGTTGRQKGAMLTHRNFMTNVESCLQVLNVIPDDNFMLILPLHHVFAFTANLLLPLAGCAEISFVENLKTIGENMAEARPTILIAVPLLLEKMYGRIQAGVKRKKIAYALTQIGLSRLVGKGILKKLGGRLRLMVTGGGPCDPELLHGWEKYGIPLREGYGLTETAPVLSMNPPDSPRHGTVGKAVPGVEITIMDPDESGTGEIAVRGENIMAGYYNNPDATVDIMQDDWLLTGDLGFLDADGFLTINGRKKSLIVNREGKNIYPDEVQNEVCKSPYILEALALGYREPGETIGERVGLIAVPDQEALDEYAAGHGKSMDEKDIEELIQTEVKRLTKQISEYKRPRRIQIRFEEFEKTSTQKIKRYLYAIDTARL